MCINELDCLQLINENLIDIKAFCYALAVALAILTVMFVITRLVYYIIGQAF